MPRPNAFAVLLKALMAVCRLRADRGAGLDRYYLGNLCAEDREAFNERQLGPEARSEMAQKQAQELREYPHPKKPVFAGRNLCVALRDEILPDLMAAEPGARTILAHAVSARRSRALDARASASAGSAK